MRTILDITADELEARVRFAMQALGCEEVILWLSEDRSDIVLATETDSAGDPIAPAGARPVPLFRARLARNSDDRHTNPPFVSHERTCRLSRGFDYFDDEYIECPETIQRSLWAFRRAHRIDAHRREVRAERLTRLRQGGAA